MHGALPIVRTKGAGAPGLATWTQPRRCSRFQVETQGQLQKGKKPPALAGGSSAVQFSKYCIARNFPAHCQLSKNQEAAEA